MVARNMDARADVWIALGQQPGVAAWFAVWLLSRLNPPARKEPRRAVSAPTQEQRVRRVRAGAGRQHEGARP